MHSPKSFHIMFIQYHIGNLCLLWSKKHTPTHHDHIETCGTDIYILNSYVISS